MNEIELLTQKYEQFAELPWDPTLTGAEKVWFAIYEPAQERRLRFRLGDFDMATRRTGHSWKLYDLTDTFAVWMAKNEYRDAYFAEPEDMDLALQEYGTFIADEVSAVLTAPDVDENTVVALVGLASLFGLTRASTLLEAVAANIRGRLLIFFPGQREGSNYRLLDARDGWNYLAVPITAREERQ